MTQDELNRERRAFWDACCARFLNEWMPDERGAAHSAKLAAMLADAKLAERDKRGWLNEG